MEFSLKYRSKIIITAYKGWISHSDKILDIGCGNTVITEQLQRHFGCSIVGTDILDYHKRDIAFRIMTHQSRLPFADKEFDIAMFNDTLHHCRDQDGLLKDAIRVAERILIFEVEPTIIAKIVDIFVNQFYNCRMNPPLNMKTFRQWQDYFERLNFDFEYRQIEKPVFIYPFKNFSFNLVKGVNYAGV